MRYILSLLLIRSGLASASVANAATGQPLTGCVTSFCDQGAGYCMRDPSDGGSGTTVLGSSLSGDNAMKWTVVQDSSRCGGRVQSGCPFNSSSLNTKYNGKQIVVLKQYTTGLCLRAAASTQWNAEMGTCDTGSEVSSAFVFDVLCGGSCNAYVSIDMANAYNTDAGLQTTNVGNQAVYAALDNIGNAWADWYCTGGC